MHESYSSVFLAEERLYRFRLVFCFSYILIVKKLIVIIVVIIIIIIKINNNNNNNNK